MNVPPVITGNRRSIFIRLVANGFGQALFNICMVLLIRLAFDRFLSTTSVYPISQLLWIGMGVVAAIIIMSYLRMAERIDAEKLGQKYIHRIRLLLFRHLSRLAPRSLQRSSRGAIVLRFVGDINSIRRWISLGFVRITVAGVTSAGTIAALFFVNPVLALGVSVVLILSVIAALFSGKRIRDAAIASRRRRSFLAANVNEKVSSMAVVQVFGQSQRERKRLKRQSNRLQDAMIDRARQIGFLRGLTHCTVAFASSIVIFLGILEVTSGRATHGTVVAAVILAGLLAPAIRDLGRVYEYWHEAKVSFEKIRQFLARSSLIKEIRNAPDLIPGPGRLDFSGVTLKGALRNVTVTAFPGNRIAIVGPNGSGKSTLLSLACRLIDPDQGKIQIDGQDIRKHSLSSLRRKIGIVSPDLPLLRGTVDKNLLYRLPDASEEEIRRIKEFCQTDKVFNSYRKGSRAQITEDGRNLSTGQRQRLALARALLGNPPILLLDEADAHLDIETSLLFDKILSEYEGTILFVSHNREKINRADVIWKIKGSEIVDRGVPNRFLDKIKSFPTSSEKIPDMQNTYGSQ